MNAPINLPPGIHANVADADYHARVPGLISKTALDYAHRSSAHYKAWLDGAEEEDTPALAFGRAFHCALLEPKRFADEYAVEPDFGYLLKHDASGTTAEQGKANKIARNEWLAANGHRILICQSDSDAILGMLRSVSSHPLASRILSGGVAEQTVRWTDDSGLPAKCRPDYFVASRRMIVDVKTTTDAGHDAFRRDVAKYRYHVQNALYRMAFRALEIPVEYFVFLPVEKEPPYAVAVYSIDDAGVERGYNSARTDIEVLSQCARTGEYPGYPSTIQTLELPPWAA